MRLTNCVRGQRFLELINVRIDRLTWEGHDFLAAARNDTIWKKTWASVKDKGVDVSFGLLKELLISGLKEQMVGS